jgi:hypothetical protein
MALTDENPVAHPTKLVETDEQPPKQAASNLQGSS